MVSFPSWNALTVFCLLCYAGAQMQRCPNEWTQFAGSCYIIGAEALTWADAEETCHIFGSDLVVIENQEENAFIKRFLSDHLSTAIHPFGSVWIGATDIFSEGKFMWLKTFQKVTFSDWSLGQPDHALGYNSEDCVQLRREYNWQWNDANCTSYSYFLCEMSATDNSPVG